MHLRNSKKLRYALHALLCVLVVAAIALLPSAINKARMDMRLRQALNFPEAGYFPSHPSLTASAKIDIQSRSEERYWTLLVDVTLTNTGEKPFLDVLAAVQMPKGIAPFLVLGELPFPLHMIVPANMLRPGSFPIGIGIGIGRATPLYPLDEIQLGQLMTLLEEPLLVKRVHDDGVELLSVIPEVTLRLEE